MRWVCTALAFWYALAVLAAAHPVQLDLRPAPAAHSTEHR